jgi:DNA-binding transcriptional regulator YiaG
MVPRFGGGVDMIATEIIALRQQLGLTQAQFADRIQSRQNTVALWEMGRHKPSPVYQRILAQLKDKMAIASGDGGQPRTKE